MFINGRFDRSILIRGCLFVWIMHVVVPPVAAQGMGLRIALHVYSGRRDPEWDFKETDDSRSYNRIISLMNTDADRNRQLPSILGYKGFTVNVVFGREIVSSLVVPRRTNPALELALLDSAPRHLVTGLIPYVREDINAQG